MKQQNQKHQRNRPRRENAKVRRLRICICICICLHRMHRGSHGEQNPLESRTGGCFVERCTPLAGWQQASRGGPETKTPRSAKPTTEAVECQRGF